MKAALHPAWLLAVALVACGNDREEAGAAGDDGGFLVTSECGFEERLPVTSANHVAGAVTYPDSPPVGGDHHECWASWEAHEAIVPPERWVHNLEHGGVVFLYHCPDGCDGDEANLQELLTFVEAHSRVLATEYPGLPGRFAAVSWGRRLVLDCVDVQAALSFYALRAANGESPESTPAPPPPECD